jgi:hypothetical protein
MISKSGERRSQMNGDLPMYVRDIITAKMAKDYKKATKREKGRILDSIQSVCGFNRSYIACRLRTYEFKRVKAKRRHGRRKYTDEDERALVEIWLLMDMPCGKGLKAIMGEDGKVRKIYDVLRTPYERVVGEFLCIRGEEEGVDETISRAGSLPIEG